MKERLVTLALAAGALLLFYALFMPKPTGPNETVALPVSTEVREDGYQGMWRWLTARGIPVLSLRDRYGNLAKQGTPATGNLLIATLPQQVPVRADEAGALQAWIEAGNTLLVMAALDDTPAWGLRTSGDLRMQMQRMAGLSIGVIGEDRRDAGTGEDTKAADSERSAESLRRAVQDVFTVQRSAIVPKAPHPLFDGVGSVATRSEYPAARWQLHGSDGSTVFELAMRTDPAGEASEPEVAMWLKRQGEGEVIVLGFASPLGNAMLGEQDNARLFANIIAWSRAADGAVLFDDAHQGLVNYYDAGAFYSDPRLHRTLLWLGLLWLLFVMGWQRLRPHRDDWNPADVTTFIKVTGGFLAGRITANRVGQRLLENFFNRIRQRLALPQDGKPVWEWLSTQAGVAPRELAQLRHLHARAHTKQRVDLIQLQNCLKTITGNLL